MYQLFQRQTIQRRGGWLRGQLETMGMRAEEALESLPMDVARGVRHMGGCAGDRA